MEVIVQTTSKVAQDLARPKPRLRETRELQAILGEYDLALAPLHTGVADEELARHFTLSVDSDQSAAELCQRLSESSAVEAAYSKPTGSAPS